MEMAYTLKMTNIAYGKEHNMKELQEYLPIIIPLVIVQLALLAYVLHHIFTHDTYKRGNRTLWVIVSIVGMEFIGPILYLVLGKSEE
jgi:hypothetical protein